MPVSKQECRYAAMRVIRKWVNYHRERERLLAPRYGELMIGGVDFDHLLKATVGEVFLKEIGGGKTPEEARDIAAVDGDDCVKTWNERTSNWRASISGNYELRRWDGAGRAEANNVYLHFLNLTR